MNYLHAYLRAFSKIFTWFSVLFLLFSIIDNKNPAAPFSLLMALIAGLAGPLGVVIRKIESRNLRG